ncbi:breast carcinoma-amplified sequence 4 [Nannospalax galili]|uniref:breast carcinoma-amplified sequence 4 n=1 Tax=Nannospalax galili TaxID=1026970 RepID=UPI0004ED3FE3|nr:breast carcinoma-amplified sequence 4 [Nannospalax galili]
MLDADQPEPVRCGASEIALFLTPELGTEAREVEAAVDRILLVLEEFCSLADMIRSDTSQMLEENIPLLRAKVTEMRSIYAQVDQLEAFVKMVGHHAAFLEAHVLKAEQDHGTFPQALWRWLGSAGLSSLGNKPVASAPLPYELPMLYRTEDYFPMDTQEAKHEVP